MKKIVCELCEGTVFTKEGGFFVCHGCGTKYSLEEAKSMMKKVEGDASGVTSAPVVSVPVGNPNQQQIDNLLILATTAYEAQNLTEAENYCNRAIELDATCFMAWFLKGKAIGWSSSVDNNRMQEATYSFCKAIDFAPIEEREDIKLQAVQELERIGIAGISLRKEKYIAYSGDEELNGFRVERKILKDSLAILWAHGSPVSESKEYLKEVARLMSEALDKALEKNEKSAEIISLFKKSGRIISVEVWNRLLTGYYNNLFLLNAIIEVKLEYDEFDESVIDDMNDLVYMGNQNYKTISNVNSSSLGWKYFDPERIMSMVKQTQARLPSFKERINDDESAPTRNTDISSDLDLMLLDMDMEEDDNPFGEEIEEDEIDADEEEFLTHDEYEFGDVDPEVFKDPTLLVKLLKRQAQEDGDSLSQ